MRLIAIDTETTGASPAKGDRCVDIGAVELTLEIFANGFQ